jgi:hypothetical protein
LDEKAMKLEVIRVETRDHYQGAQEPMAFWWHDRRYDIAQVLDRWYEGSVDSTRMPLRYYKVMTGDGRVFIIRYHDLFTTWSLVVPADESEA